jgi:hypothetical protein
MPYTGITTILPCFFEKLYYQGHQKNIPWMSESSISTQLIKSYSSFKTSTDMLTLTHPGWILLPFLWVSVFSVYLLKQNIILRCLQILTFFPLLTKMGTLQWQLLCITCLFGFNKKYMWPWFILKLTLGKTLNLNDCSVW